MNLSVNIYPDYKSWNYNNIRPDAVNFESKVRTLNTSRLPEQIKSGKLRMKSADILTKISLAIFGLRQKIKISKLLKK